MTGCFWSSNNLFFCSTEILDVLVGNKFSSFCLSRKLRESNRNNLEPFKIFATMVMSLLFVLHYVTSVFFFPKKALNNLSYNSKQLNKLILFELYKIIKLDFLFKNLLLTYFLSKIFIKHYKPIQLKKQRASLPVFVLYLCVSIWTPTLLSFFFILIFKLVF